MQLQQVSAERAASTDTPPALHSSIIIHRNGLSYMYITCTRPLEAYDLAWVVRHSTAPHHFIANFSGERKQQPCDKLDSSTADARTDTIHSRGRRREREEELGLAGI